MALYEDLLKRVLEAKVRAERVLLEAQRLRDLSERMRAARAGDVSIYRCAWCGRFKVRDEWLHLDEVGRGRQHMRGALLSRASHGICPACFARQSGGSAEWPLQEDEPDRE